jgi:hypothetical protein
MPLTIYRPNPLLEKLEVHLANSKLSRQARHMAGLKEPLFWFCRSNPQVVITGIPHSIDSYSCVPTIGTYVLTVV